MGKVRAFAPHIAWSPTEEAILLMMYSGVPAIELAVLLPGRNHRVIQCKANELGLKRAVDPGRTIEQRREAKRVAMNRARQSDPDGMRAKGRAWHYANRPANLIKMRDYYARRFFWGRAMKLRGEGRATFRDLASLWHKQRGRCALTGRRLDRLAQLDHIVARARGGSDEKSNLRWLCKEANLARRELSDAEFVALCRDVVAKALT